MKYKTEIHLENNYGIVFILKDYLVVAGSWGWVSRLLCLASLVAAAVVALWWLAAAGGCGVYHPSSGLSQYASKKFPVFLTAKGENIYTKKTRGSRVTLERVMRGYKLIKWIRPKGG